MADKGGDLCSPRIHRCLLLCLLAFGLATSPLFAQIKSSSISGLVQDATKAAVPAANVTVLQQATGVSTTASSNATGEFSVPYLQQGLYTVTVQKQGFQTFRQADIPLSENQKYNLNVTLAVGAIATTVEVTAASAQLQTESTTVQSSVQSSLIEAIPNVTQNPMYYAILQAGVVPRMQLLQDQSSTSFGIGFDGRRAFSAFNMDGAEAFTNEIMLDGLSVTGNAWNEATVLPNSDSLQEVRVLTNNYSAEYGHGQGVVEMGTRAGGNQFHGDVYYRNRNEALNANTFLNNAQGIDRPAFKVNDFGGSMGGRIIKDKLFFFGSYERLLHSDQPEWLLNVPTDNQRAGNFLGTLTNFNGTPSQVVLYNPNSNTQIAPNVYQQALYANGGTVIPNPDPRGLALMSVYPHANRTPIDVYNDDNFFTSVHRSFVRNNTNDRLDYHRGNQSFYFSGGVEIGSITTPSPYGKGSPYYVPPNVGQVGVNEGSSEPEQDSDDNPYFQMGDTIIINPTLVVDIRYGLQRVHTNYLSNIVTNFTASDYNNLGAPSSVQAVFPEYGAAPDIQGFANYSAASNSWYNNKHERQTNHQIIGSLTKSAGKWTLKGGAEFRVDLSNYTDFQNAAAFMQPYTEDYEYITANGGGTAQDVNYLQGGSGYGDMLEGAGGWGVAATFSPHPALAQKYFGIYTQNDFHATDRLTLNLGLRWEFQPGPTERFNRPSALNLNQVNAWNIPGVFVVPGHNGVSRNLWSPTYDDFGPRVGAAYRFGDKSVLRAGYGVSYSPNNMGWYDGPYCYGMGAFAYGTQIIPYGESPNGTMANFWDPAASPIIPEVGADPNAAVRYGSANTPYFNYNDERPPRYMQWNIGVEHRFTSNWLLSVFYTGAHGNNLLQSRFPLQSDQNIPATVQNSWNQIYAQSNGVTNPATQQVANPLQPTTGPLIPFQGQIGATTIQQDLLYYPYLTLINTTMQRDSASSTYNALQFRLRHTFSQGIFLDGSYTWSKAVDNAYTELQDMQGFSNTTSGGSGNDNLDIMNLRNDKKLSYSDIPNRVVVMATYELPFHKLAMNNVGHDILNHWKLGTVYMAQAGIPVGETDDAPGALNGRTNLSGQAFVLPKSYQRWYDGNTTVTLPDGRLYTPSAMTFLKYNPDAFIGDTVSTPDGSVLGPLYDMGTAAIDYSAMRAGAVNNVSLTLARDFRIKESVTLSFRANVSNAFNHPQWLPSDYDMDLGGAYASSPTSPLPASVKNGQGSSESYGAHSMNTYDPREVILEGRITF